MFKFYTIIVCSVLLVGCASTASYVDEERTNGQCQKLIRLLKKNDLSSRSQRDLNRLFETPEMHFILSMSNSCKDLITKSRIDYQEVRKLESEIQSLLDEANELERRFNESYDK